MKIDMTRYSCQLPLSGFGIETQTKLHNAKVLIVGLGGLGCPVSQYLTAVGVGTLGIADYDTVKLKNLHRQILYGDQDIGKPKVNVASQRLREQNSTILVIEYPQKINTMNVLKIIEAYDIVVDCTDNFETRYLLNDACVIGCKPLISGSIFQYEGQVAAWNVKNSNGTMSSNYRDIFPAVDNTTTPNCETSGVIPTIAGVIGSVQATEVIKYIAGSGDLLTNRLFIFNVKTMSSYVVELPRVTKTQILSLKPEVEVPLISATALKASLKKNLYELLDVRSEKEHKELNIGGKNIPLSTLTKNINQFNFDLPTVIYCKSGIRSAKAVKCILKNNPQSKVISLDGGMQSWN